MPESVFIPTYTEKHGKWIQSALDNDDIDGDHVPNDIDNCPGIYNPWQENCNKDAEIDRGAELLGDACDPTPCPNIEQEINYEVIIKNNRSQCSETGIKRVVRNLIKPELMGSHNLFSGAVRPQLGRVTEFRFCQLSIESERFCSLDQSQRTDAGLGAPDNTRATWRPITLRGLGLGGYMTYDYPSSPPALTWDYWTDHARWKFDGWFETTIDPKPSLTPDFLWQTSSGLEGVIGLRAGGARSTNVYGTVTYWDNGIHRTSYDPLYREGEGLSRYYREYAEPDPVVMFSQIDKCLYCFGNCNPISFDIHDYLSHYRQFVINPILSTPDIRATIAIPGQAMFVPSRFGWGFIDNEGVLNTTPGLFSKELISALNNENTMYVAAVEPSLAQGIGYRKVQGIILDNHAAAIIDSVLATPTGLDLQGIAAIGDGSISAAVGISRSNSALTPPAGLETKPTPKSKIPGLGSLARYLGIEPRKDSGLTPPAGLEPRDPVPDSAVGSGPISRNMGIGRSPAGSSTGTTGSDPIADTDIGFGPVSRTLGIAPRTEFVPVFSRVLGALFIVGGQTELGANTGEIWMVKENSSPVKLALPGYSPRKVLAATVGLTDLMLWILDEGPLPDAIEESDIGVRLARIDVSSLNYEIAWEERNTNEWDKQWLIGDRDGQVLLVASSTLLDEHVTVRFEATPYMLGTARIASTDYGLGALVAAPLVGDRDYLYLTQNSEGRIQPVRLSALNQLTPQ